MTLIFALFSSKSLGFYTIKIKCLYLCEHCILTVYKDRRTTVLLNNLNNIDKYKEKGRYKKINKKNLQQQRQKKNATIFLLQLWGKDLRT